jgi:tetratricopeptide (TPR) repeat protein
MTTALPKVFISYRRSDSLGATGRLYDRLNAAYPGMFFRDVSAIGVGVDFTQEIERAVASSVALIAVIGPTWATEAVDGKRRLEDPEDFVRLEISSALKRNIRIIPVLVGGAAMPSDEQLPPDLDPLRRWNAIQLVEEYYDQGLQRLIDALRPQLGEPRTEERVGHVETDRRIKELRGQAEAALAVEDWLAGIQALQAAVSLDPNNPDLGTRLRWAHDQHKISGLFAEGQQLYDKGKKEQALARFRQVRVAAGNYRNVIDLIQQLEGEVTTDTRRSTVRRWTAGAVAALVVGLIGLGALGVWIGQQFDEAISEVNNTVDSFDDVGGTGSEPVTNPLSPGLAPRQSAAPPPAPSPRDDAAIPAERQAMGVGFPARGRWQMTAQDNAGISIALLLQDDGSFAVSMPAGVLDVPLSGGRFAYNDSTGMLQISGINNMGEVFNELIHVFEREDDHFHARYLGAVWELRPAD